MPSMCLKAAKHFFSIASNSHGMRFYYSRNSAVCERQNLMITDSVNNCLLHANYSVVIIERDSRLSRTVRLSQKTERTPVLAKDVFSTAPVLKAHTENNSVSWRCHRILVHDEFSDVRPL